MTVVSAAVVALVVGLLALTQIQNEAESVSEQVRVKAAFEDRVRALKSNAHIFAQWDEAALNLAVGFNPAWADENEAQYLYEQFGYEHTFVIDGAGRTLYASTKGRRSQADPQRLIGAAYLQAFSRVRRAPALRAVAGVGGGSEGPLIFGIARFRGNSDEVDRRVRHERYLLTIKKIDGPVVDQISLLSRGPKAINFIADVRTGNGYWPIRTYDGKSVGTLAWTPDFTGSRLRDDLAPWLSLLIILIAGLAVGVILRARDALRLADANQVRANYLAAHDALTGLPNRRAFLEHLDEVRSTGREYVLFFLDLDGFKEVNDTFGHAAGDALLRKTGRRLAGCSPENAYVARLGGDEFALVVQHDLTRDAIGTMATQLSQIVQEPHEFGGAPTVVGVSIGIASSRHEKHDDVIRKADAAMYAAKAERRNGWKIYSSAIQKSQCDGKELENDLRCALANGEISLVFQPIMRLRDDRITALEALVRWTHPIKGPIPPDVFIPIAEKTGIIVELGKHILRTACLAARDWPYNLNVNLSPAQFWDRGLVAGVTATLEETGFPAARLEFEITETYLSRRTDPAARIVERLRKVGTTIALDDFGSGYASIAYLRAFEFDVVKIDRSVIERVGIDPNASDMLVAIVALCNALKLPCLAEGVETEDQAAMCRSAGCQYIQGWYVGQPVAAVNISKGRVHASHTETAHATAAEGYDRSNSAMVLPT